MTMIQALFLGALQGLTELLPVSSSGHLVLLESFWQLPVETPDMLTFDIVLHGGTLFALIICYLHTWRKMAAGLFSVHADKTLLMRLIVATIPAVIAGLLLKDSISTVFRTPGMVGFAFIVTAVILLWGEQFRKNLSALQIKKVDAFLIGCAQAFALIPGISRSGLTISMGRAIGLSRSEALDFSFLMAVPVIAGAVILSLPDVFSAGSLLPVGIMVVGFLSSFLVSVFAILFLKKLVATTSLRWFAWYLISVGLLLAATGISV